MRISDWSSDVCSSDLDYRVWSGGVECGAGWLRRSEASGKLYVSLTLEAPEFGPRRIYANLGRAAGQDNPDVYALLWNPRSEEHTSELQSLMRISYAVFCLKKKQDRKYTRIRTTTYY